MLPNWNNKQKLKDSLVDQSTQEQFERLEPHRQEFIMRRTWDNSENTYRNLWASVLIQEQSAIQEELEQLRSHRVRPEKPFTPEHG